MPQGHLRAVEELRPPLRLVQQPVLPEIDRVHADRWSDRSPASGAPAATTTRSSSTAASTGRSRSRSTRRRRTRAWPARRATPSCTWTARWATATSPSSIRRCTSWRPARIQYVHALDHFLTYLNPEPHRRSFMKPFMREQSAEFCSTCHKVHLDVPVNNYRWFRGFNDYDNWQASGVSGQGARSFYYPPKSQVCADCHMPLVPSHDPGNHDGKVHSHRFPAANTGRRVRRTRTTTQLKATEQFLKSGFITVDIFAVSPVEDARRQPPWCAAPATGRKRCPASRWARKPSSSGDRRHPRSGQGRGAARPGRQPKFEPGSTARVDVVVRTRKIGHFFPAGTVDAFDVWLELQGHGRRWPRDLLERAGGRRRHGPVEPGAHFYKSYQLDGDGNPINKRNAWQARSVLYVRLIPPGAADVAHYRVRDSERRQGADHLHREAELPQVLLVLHAVRVRRAAEAGAGSSAAECVITTPGVLASTKQHSDKRLGRNQGSRFRICRSSRWRRRRRIDLATAAETKLDAMVAQKDRERWNDWGIGLLLQGDLKGAEYAFTKVTEAEPDYADGWLNVARALIQEGETDAAKPFIEKALAVNSKLGRIYFFKAHDREDRWRLRWRAGIAATRREPMYPRDRVVLNQIGADSIPETAIRGGDRGAGAGLPRWIRKICRCTTR